MAKKTTTRGGKAVVENQRATGSHRPMWKVPVIEAYKPGIDRTLLKENLKLTVDERFLQLMELQRLAEELRRAGNEARKTQ